MRQSNDAATIAHVLNRAAYGPRRGDWQHVEAVGVEAYIGEQLEPERIADAEVEAKLEALPSLKMDIAGLYRDYPPPQLGERLLREDEELDEEARRRIAQQSRVPLQELGAARLLRAVESDRQLNEVLVDFWFNHFNVFANAGQVRYLLSTYEREAIRPHVFGSFRAMLGAVAQSPAMLVYLDNWRSAAEEGRKVAGAPPRARNDAVEDAIRRMARGGGRVDPRRLQRMQQRVQQAQRGNRPPGLNENYARELMELHTLSVDGGYTQDDVREVARALTGWTLTLGARQADDPGFVFRPDWHDAEEKRVLGTTLAAGRGVEDGEQVLDLLAEHPSTAGFIAVKLCRKLVADQPPPDLVVEVAATFRRTGGDLRATTAAILRSKEFLGPEHRAAKVKSPLEFLASAARALEVPVGTDGMLARTLQLLGAPLYGASPPTGYPDTAAEWTSANAILARMDVGSRLAAIVYGGETAAGRAASGRRGRRGRGGERGPQGSAGERSGERGPQGSAGERSDALLEQLLPGRAGDELRTKILAWADAQDEAPDNAEIAALILGSPEFQRR